MHSVNPHCTRRWLPWVIQVQLFIQACGPPLAVTPSYNAISFPKAFLPTRSQSSHLDSNHANSHLDRLLCIVAHRTHQIVVPSWFYSTANSLWVAISLPLHEAQLFTDLGQSSFAREAVADTCHHLCLSSSEMSVSLVRCATELVTSRLELHFYVRLYNGLYTWWPNLSEWLGWGCKSCLLRTLPSAGPLRFS